MPVNKPDTPIYTPPVQTVGLIQIPVYSDCFMSSEDIEQEEINQVSQVVSIKPQQWTLIDGWLQHCGFSLGGDNLENANLVRHFLRGTADLELGEAPKEVELTKVITEFLRWPPIPTDSDGYFDCENLLFSAVANTCLQQANLLPPKESCKDTYFRLFNSENLGIWPFANWMTSWFKKNEATTAEPIKRNTRSAADVETVTVPYNPPPKQETVDYCNRTPKAPSGYGYQNIMDNDEKWCDDIVKINNIPPLNATDPALQDILCKDLEKQVIDRSLTSPLVNTTTLDTTKYPEGPPYCNPVPVKPNMAECHKLPGWNSLQSNLKSSGIKKFDGEAKQAACVYLKSTPQLPQEALKVPKEVTQVLPITPITPATPILEQLQAPVASVSAEGATALSPEDIPSLFQRGVAGGSFMLNAAFTAIPTMVAGVSEIRNNPKELKIWVKNTLKIAAATTITAASLPVLAGGSMATASAALAAGSTLMAMQAPFTVLDIINLVNKQEVSFRDKGGVATKYCHDNMEWDTGAGISQNAVRICTQMGWVAYHTANFFKSAVPAPLWLPLYIPTIAGLLTKDTKPFEGLNCNSSMIESELKAHLPAILAMKKLTSFMGENETARLIKLLEDEKRCAYQFGKQKLSDRQEEMFLSEFVEICYNHGKGFSRCDYINAQSQIDHLYGTRFDFKTVSLYNQTYQLANIENPALKNLMVLLTNLRAEDKAFMTNQRGSLWSNHVYNGFISCVIKILALKENALVSSREQDVGYSHVGEDYEMVPLTSAESQNTQEDTSVFSYHQPPSLQMPHHRNSISSASYHSTRSTIDECDGGNYPIPRADSGSQDSLKMSDKALEAGATSPYNAKDDEEEEEEFYDAPPPSYEEATGAAPTGSPPQDIFYG